MIMIVGGLAQGKREYARDNYDNADERIFMLNEWAFEKFQKEEDALAQIKEQISANPDMICVTLEIGKGVVPIDKTERDFRDWMGRLQVEVAKLADEVIRVTCGIGQKIK